ncbi:hypothetical protein BCR32DRAFT_115439 [Anaeromyces robustus]|uniref:Uncharacterized protein n=1 Tax=Anaeromyces robustus TaxID=1754192 RepID=A0A1Y1VX56_9FUNG|nr:hypothetical protein BCR32DRAFT_115439 [Anaeromyces robustus]|eukprot:ORX65324.1 hypothetical protein BCR32DRAFT_115439 [Anaeromyces robustus]
MLCKYIIALAIFTITSTYAAICNRDIECLTKNAQMTFLGRVIGIEQTNATMFSAEVQPLCTMFSTVANTKIDDEEFKRTVFIDGFGTHAGGTCNADAGIVGDTNIFFVWVNASSIHGVARRFGLFDPCYGAFKNTPENAQILNNVILSQTSAVQTPIGVECPEVKATTDNNGNGNGPINLDEDLDSNAILKYSISSIAIIISLFYIFFM